mmetsp:Transcript_36912/g.82701  ORF Transcript_36912/g.82701 Transcript_36912/m.82701 type:complete len:357 (-) Transcript_36912:1931-3001(-)
MFLHVHGNREALNLALNFARAPCSPRLGFMVSWIFLRELRRGPKRSLFLVRQVTEGGDAVHDPDVRVDLGGELHGHDEVGGHARGGEHALPLGGLVHGAAVVRRARLVAHRRREVHHGQRAVHLLGLGLGQRLPLRVPPRALQEETVDEDAVLGPLGELGRLHVAHALGVELELELVDRHLILAGVRLQRTRHEPLREEKDGQGEAVGLALEEPGPKEVHPVEEVLDPAPQSLERREAHRSPQVRHLVVRERRVHVVQVRRHDNKPLDGEFDIPKARVHAVDKAVELDHLLGEHDGERVEEAVRLQDKSRRPRVVHLELGRDLRLEGLHELHDDLVRGLPVAAARRPRLQTQDFGH